MPRHLVSVPPGPHLLSDLVLSSPVLSEDRGIPPEAMDVPGGPSGSGGAYALITLPKVEEDPRGEDTLQCHLGAVNK
jgi:hypothetical protein